MFCKWRDIAKTMRGKVFDDDMEEEIDVFDLEVGKPISPYDLAHWVP